MVTGGDKSHTMSDKQDYEIIMVTPNQVRVGIIACLLTVAAFITIQFFLARDLTHTLVAKNDIVQFSTFSLIYFGGISILSVLPYPLYLRVIKRQVVSNFWKKLAFSCVGLIVATFAASLVLAIWLPSHLEKNGYSPCESLSVESFMGSNVWIRETVECPPFIPGPFGNNVAGEE